MDEKSITNTELEEALVEMTESEEEGKRFLKAKRTVSDMVKGLKLDAGMYRIGEFRITVKDITGGGFEIPSWESKSVAITGPEGFTG